MSAVQTRVVEEKDDGLRLDRWFRTYYPGLNHGALEKLLRTGQIRVNGGRVKANRRVETGEAIRIPPIGDAVGAKTPVAAPKREDAEFIRSIALYEDDEILAVNKPFGLAVQGGAKTKRHVDGMLASLEKNGERPRLVHRLDQDTGGLLILAKTRKAAASLSKAFQGRGVSKTYWALCRGLPEIREGTINLRIAKKMVRVGAGEQERMTPADDDSSKKAITDYMVLDSAGPVSFLALKPLTGRTHQLRVHCAAMGTPIVGDRKYGGPDADIEGAPKGMHLFCRSMTFPHPAHGRAVTLTAPLSGRMKESWALFGFDADVDVVWPDLSQKKKR
ncbi:MAG: RluA family pseudouridine synthase [Parvularculaceae bacterium]|nr:RluA family pseudouridine synthase [Parvularculaceae bacterium]